MEAGQYHMQRAALSWENQQVYIQSEENQTPLLDVIDEKRKGNTSCQPKTQACKAVTEAVR